MLAKSGRMFPCRLELPPATLGGLLAGVPGEGALVGLVGPLVRDWLEGQREAVTLEEGDLTLYQRIPNQDFSPSAKRRLTVLDIHARGALLHSSALTPRIQVDMNTICLSLQGHVDAKIILKGRVRGELRYRIFGSWNRAARETVDASISTSGKIAVRADVVAKNMRLEVEGDRLLLRFELECQLEGKPEGWSVDNIDPGKCEIRVCGIKLGSYVRFAEKKIGEAIRNNMDKWMKLEGPKLVKKLEGGIQQNIGEVVTIELVSW